MAPQPMVWTRHIVWQTPENPSCLPNHHFKTSPTRVPMPETYFEIHKKLAIQAKVKQMLTTDGVVAMWFKRYNSLNFSDPAGTVVINCFEEKLILAHLAVFSIKTLVSKERHQIKQNLVGGRSPKHLTAHWAAH